MTNLPNSYMTKVNGITISCFDHRDCDNIEDNFQLLIETEIGLPDVRIDAETVIQDFYNEKSEYKRDAFYIDGRTGCREIPLMR